MMKKTVPLILALMALWDDETMADVFVKETQDFIARQKKDKSVVDDLLVLHVRHPRYG